MSKFLSKRQRRKKQLSKQQSEKEERQRQQRRDQLDRPLNEGVVVEARLDDTYRGEQSRDHRRRSGPDSAPSALSMPSKIPHKVRRYDGDMADREQEAQKEIERKKKRVAPAYNKGAYQYVTEETDPKDIGRK